MLKNFNINYLIFFCQQLFETVILSIKYDRWFFLSSSPLWVISSVQSWFFRKSIMFAVKDGATVQRKWRGEKQTARERERGERAQWIGESVIIFWHFMLIYFQLLYFFLQCKLIHLSVKYVFSTAKTPKTMIIITTTKQKYEENRNINIEVAVEVVGCSICCCCCYWISRLWIYAHAQHTHATQHSDTIHLAWSHHLCTKKYSRANTLIYNVCICGCQAIVVHLTYVFENK